MKEEKKSSKEILSELFDKFNATPPSSPLIHSASNDNEPKIECFHKKIKKKAEKDKLKKKKKKEKKSKKKHNDKKSKKKKKKRHRSRSPSLNSSYSDSVNKSPKKKKRKDFNYSLECRKKTNETTVKIKKEKCDTNKNKSREELKEPSEKCIAAHCKAKINNESNGEPSFETSCLSNSVLESNVAVQVVLPDLIPVSCKTKEQEVASKIKCVEEIKSTESEGDSLIQVADIFVEELLESTLAVKSNSTSEKPKVNIKITDLKKSNILELAEQKLKEKAQKYEEGEITSDSSEDYETLTSLQPVDSDVADEVSPKSKKEKLKKSSHHKSHKHSHRKGSKSRSGSRGRRRSHSKEHCKSKRSRSRSRGSKRKRSVSQERKKENRLKENRSHRERSGHLKKERKEEKPDRREKEHDKKDSDIKDEKRRRSKERRSKSRERRRNKSKSPLQLPSMILQDNPNKKKRRSRSRTRGLDIDKKKLLEIARKNALNMLKQQGASVTAVADPAKVTTTITAGGKTVDELTDFCKQLSQKEGRDENVELSPISESSEDETEKAFHHPFLIKDRPSNIVMNIRNCAALPVKTHQEKTAEAAQQLRLQFPVSSGQHHRRTESEWVPVEPKKDEPVVTKSNKNIAKPVALAESIPKAIEPPPPPPPELVSVFPSVEESVNINIGDVVGQKLAAMKRLQDNPTDFGAQHLLRDAEEKLARWNESNQLQLPGLFTGSTGARLLTPAELASGQQAWAKKDQLMCAQPVTEGIGKSLLQKMGWKPGEGLGKNHEGTLEPLSLPLKMDKRGLVCAEEVKRPPRFLMGHTPKNIRKPTVKSLEGKHPVSLLLEYCSKRHFNPPIFNVCFESGPSHKRMFLFKVEVNGIEYQPQAPSNNKKQAKSEAAIVCLRALGLMPSTTVPSILP